MRLLTIFIIFSLWKGGLNYYSTLCAIQNKWYFGIKVKFLRRLRYWKNTGCHQCIKIIVVHWLMQIYSASFPVCSCHVYHGAILNKKQKQLTLWPLDWFLVTEMGHIFKKEYSPQNRPLPFGDHSVAKNDELSHMLTDWGEGQVHCHRAFIPPSCASGWVSAQMPFFFRGMGISGEADTALLVSRQV